MVSACSQMLAKAGLTISFAESASAGKLAYEFSLTASAGQVLKGGVVCYDAGVKVRVLGVPRYVIDEHTPESAEVTRVLTKGVKDLLESDVGVGITGLLAPGGARLTKNRSERSFSAYPQRTVLWRCRRSSAAARPR